MTEYDKYFIFNVNGVPSVATSVKYMPCQKYNPRYYSDFAKPTSEK